MQSKFIRISELASTPGRNGRPARQGRLPVSCATIWRWVKLGEFPKPVRLGPQVSAGEASIYHRHKDLGLPKNR